MHNIMNDNNIFKNFYLDELTIDYLYINNIKKIIKYNNNEYEVKHKNSTN